MEEIIMKITVTLNGGKEINVDAPSYNASEITEKMNDPQITMVNIGDVVLGKHSVMMIAPFVEPVKEVPVA